MKEDDLKRKKTIFIQLYQCIQHVVLNVFCDVFLAQFEVLTPAAFHRLSNILMFKRSIKKNVFQFQWEMIRWKNHVFISLFFLSAVLLLCSESDLSELFPSLTVSFHCRKMC